jgi:transposase
MKHKTEDYKLTATKCKSCSGVWNRDCNGATNIYKIVKNAINKIDRPRYLCRRNNSDTLEEVSHP